MVHSVNLVIHGIQKVAKSVHVAKAEFLVASKSSNLSRIQILC